MGRRFRAWLDGRVYCCSGCGTHVAEADDIVSKVREGGKSETLN
jgi:calcineurin-like phosphoesterase